MKTCPPSYVLHLLVFTLAVQLIGGEASAQRARREYISINTDTYEISAQTDGAVSVRTVDGLSLFSRVQARVRYADEEQFRRLNTDARDSMRFQVHDRLGQGQGLLFQTRACDWHLRAYPGQPYMSVRLVYKNTGNNPVAVAALSPWFTGQETRGTFIGGDAASPVRFHCREESGTRIRSGQGSSREAMAIHHPGAGHVILVGFITHNRAETSVHIAVDAAGRQAGQSNLMAICEFDPPVVVAPGETLEAEELYISLGDVDVVGAFEGYGAALAAVHDLEPARPRLTAGLDGGGMFRSPSAQQLLEAIAWQQRRLHPWRWRTFVVGLGWEQDTGVWEPDPERFPDGFAPVVAAAQRADIRAGIRFRPFLVAADADLATRHPEWLLHYERDETLRVLDVTNTAVQEWLTERARTFTEDWGFQNLFVEEADCLLHCTLPEESNSTRIQFYRLGLSAIRAGIRDSDLLAVSPWHPAALSFAHSLGPVNTATPVWSSALDMEAAMALQGHLYPTGVMPNAGVVHLHNPVSDASQQAALSREQGIAWIMAAALSGSPIFLGNRPETLTDADISLLGRFSPALPRAAYTTPRDNGQTSSIKHLPIRTSAGEWHLVAFFNWSRISAETLHFATGRLGLDPETAYTMHEFLPDVYHGLLRNETTLIVPPASVRFFGLRPFAGHPMLLTSDRHISQGAYDHDSIVWDSEARTLKGVLRADPLPYRLRILVPAPWRYRDAQVSVQGFDAIQERDEIVTLSFTPAARESVVWKIAFE